MAQTPAQRRANEKFAKTNEKKMGKPESSYKKKEVSKSPVGPVVIGLLVFVVIAPVFLELLKLFPQALEFVMSTLRSIGIVSK